MKKITYLLMLIPGIFLLLGALFYPLIGVLFPTFSGEGFFLGRYISFFTDSYYRVIFIRTLRIAVLATFICVILGVPTAYFISRRSRGLKSLLMGVSIFPLLINSVIRSFAWINILGRNGTLNTLLLRLRIVKEPLSLLYTDFSILIGTIYLFLPLMLITLVGSMDNIEDDISEAAESLGASRIHAFFKVVLPLSLPGILVGAVLVFTGSITAYTTPNLLGGNKHMLMATFIYQRAMSLSDWTGAGVIAMIMILITFAMVYFMQSLAHKLDRRYM
ncbi:MAG: ABC transporter permease [Treponema sp.]|jgi:putative spermidine/putrescine transport system permease protein|nr:ABC transporter permease [Treponema sp.]